MKLTQKTGKVQDSLTQCLHYLGYTALAITRVELIFTYDHGNFMLEPSLLKSNWTNFWVNFSRGLDLLEFQANNEILSGSSLNSKLGSKTNDVQANLDLGKILKIFLIRNKTPYIKNSIKRWSKYSKFSNLAEISKKNIAKSLSCAFSL